MATLTVTPTQTFISGDTVVPATLNQLAQSTVALTAGTVTVADLATATIERLLPAGAVMPFAMNSAPSGWLAANGDPVLRVGTYAALFAAIGTTHGAGDGSTTFNVPDLRGIFVRGSGSQVLGAHTYSGTLGTKQQDQLRSHVHSFLDRDTSYIANVAGAAPGGNSVVSTIGPTVSNLTKDTAGAGGAETYPANIALLYCIKF